MAEALYRKYRPQVFDDVVGQDFIERTLKNAVTQDKVSHAYLFTGPRGTGKTTTARLLSKALICQKGPTSEPDGTCEECKLIADGEHPDVYELDAASRTGVDTIRSEIIERVAYSPTRGRYKIYIIDEVHMLSTGAFNALLKTLEEPPEHVVFILCTTDPQKVPETIHSRCQRFDFKSIPIEEMIGRLGAVCELEDVEFEGDALDLIAHRAAGGMRDALTSLEQLIAFGEGKVTVEQAERLLGSLDSSEIAEVVDAIGKRDVGACFTWTSEYMETGADLAQFAQDLTEHFRNMYVMSLAGADVALDVTEASRREMESELSMYGPDRLSRMLEIMGDVLRELRTSTNQRLTFEIALTRMARPETDNTISSLADRVESLERELYEIASHGLASGSNAASSSFPSKSSKRAADANAPAAQSGSRNADASGPEHGAKAGVPVPDGVGVADEAYEAASSPKAEQLAQAQAGSSADAAAPSADVPAESRAQAPASADASQAPSPSGIPRDANAFWKSAYAHLKKSNAPYAVMYMKANPSIQNGTLVLEFPEDAGVLFNTAQSKDAREALEAALARAGASDMPYKLVQSEARQASARPTLASTTSSQEAKASQKPEAVSQEAAETRPDGEAVQELESKPASGTEPEASAVIEPETQMSESDPQVAEEAPTDPEPEFADFLTSAFGEGILIEEEE